MQFVFPLFTIDHWFIVGLYIQENTLSSFVIISISAIAPLCCEWFIEELFGNLVYNSKTATLILKFLRHSHERWKRRHAIEQKRAERWHSHVSHFESLVIRVAWEWDICYITHPSLLYQHPKEHVALSFNRRRQYQLSIFWFTSSHPDFFALTHPPGLLHFPSLLPLMLFSNCTRNDKGEIDVCDLILIVMIQVSLCAIKQICVKYRTAVGVNKLIISWTMKLATLYRYIHYTMSSYRDATCALVYTQIRL